MALLLNKRMIACFLVAYLLSTQSKKYVEGLANQNVLLTIYKASTASDKAINQNHPLFLPNEPSKGLRFLMKHGQNTSKRGMVLSHKVNETAFDSNIMGIDISHLLKPSLKGQQRQQQPLMDVDLSILGNKKPAPIQHSVKQVILPNDDDTSSTDWSDFPEDLNCPDRDDDQPRYSHNFDWLFQDDNVLEEMQPLPVNHRKNNNKVSGLISRLPPMHDDESSEQLRNAVNEIYQKNAFEEMLPDDSYEDALTDFLQDQISMTHPVVIPKEQEDNVVFPIPSDTTGPSNRKNNSPVDKRSLFVSESWKPGGFPDFVIAKTPRQNQASNQNYAYTSVFVSNGWKPGGKRMQYFYPTKIYEYFPNLGFKSYNQQNMLSASFPRNPATEPFQYPPYPIAFSRFPSKRKMI